MEGKIMERYGVNRKRLYAILHLIVSYTKSSFPKSLTSPISIQVGVIPLLKLYGYYYEVLTIDRKYAGDFIISYERYDVGDIDPVNEEFILKTYGDIEYNGERLVSNYGNVSIIAPIKPLMFKIAEDIPLGQDYQDIADEMNSKNKFGTPFDMMKLWNIRDRWYKDFLRYLRIPSINLTDQKLKIACDSCISYWPVRRLCSKGLPIKEVISSMDINAHPRILYGTEIILTKLPNDGINIEFYFNVHDISTGKGPSHYQYLSFGKVEIQIDKDGIVQKYYSNNDIDLCKNSYPLMKEYDSDNRLLIDTPFFKLNNITDVLFVSTMHSMSYLYWEQEYEPYPDLISGEDILDFVINLAYQVEVRNKCRANKDKWIENKFDLLVEEHNSQVMYNIRSYHKQGLWKRDDGEWVLRIFRNSSFDYINSQNMEDYCVISVSNRIDNDWTPEIQLGLGSYTSYRNSYTPELIQKYFGNQVLYDLMIAYKRHQYLIWEVNNKNES